MKYSSNQPLDVSMDLIGEGVARARIQSSLTQADLARKAGISKRTLERLEAGQSVQTQGFFRVLQALSLLGPLFDPLLKNEEEPSPMFLLKAKGKKRQRVSLRLKEESGPKKAWTWGEDK